jgi:acetyl esterase/lipase
VYDAYPFDRLKGKLAQMVIHGDQDNVNPIDASQKMAEAAKAAGVDTVYATVPGGTHLEAYLTFASQIFDFLAHESRWTFSDGGRLKVSHAIWTFLPAAKFTAAGWA